MKKDTRIAVTLGDPSGVGPEVIVKALTALPEDERGYFTVVGNVSALERANRSCGTSLAFSTTPKAGAITVDEVPIDGDLPEIGKVSPVAGDASVRYIRRAVEMALAHDVECIVTAPINKEAMNLAGHHYDGHTGLLAHLTASKSSFMLLASERLNTIHVSTHISLKGAIERAKTERVLATIEAGHQHFPAHRQKGAHRRRRPQPALRRKRPVRHGRYGIPGAGRRTGARQGHRRRRADLGRHGVCAGL